MYLILLFIISTNLILWYFYKQDYSPYLNVSKPQSQAKPQIKPKSCPKGYKNQGNSCVPSTTMVQHGLNYLEKNPTKKIPDAYKPLVENGYLQKKGNEWTSNPNPSGKPPAYINNQGGSTQHGSQGGSSQHGSQGGISAAPSGFSGVVKANSSLVCSNVGYQGGRLCSGNRASTSLFVEDDAIQNDSAKPTFTKAAAANPNGIRAGYLNLGTPNAGMTGIPTTSGYCQGYLKHQQGCIDWGNSSVASKAIKAAENIIDKTKAAGGNAIRFDEMDVCQGNSKCQAGLNNSLVQISKYAAQQGMALVGADYPPSVTALLQAQKKGGAPVVAALVDASASDNAQSVKDMKAAVGNLPIIDDNTG